LLKTTVSVSAWAATHLPLNFTDPLSFRPERWFDSERETFPRHKKEASQPFSYGPRGCIGRNLAYIEQRLIMARLLWNFDLDIATGATEVQENRMWSEENDMNYMKAYLVWVKPEFWGQLKRVVR
jgi:cytochrome P450